MNSLPTVSSLPGCKVLRPTLLKNSLPGTPDERKKNFMGTEFEDHESP